MSSTNPDSHSPRGLLPCPLYHGTSTLWRESIITHGLGGRNILLELRAFQFLEQARSHLAGLPPSDHLDPVSQLSSDLIGAQAVTAAGFNFRHGGLYLTPSRTKAAAYASDLGSEHLGECRTHRDAILRAENGASPRWWQDHHELLSVLSNPGTPLLVRIDAVHPLELGTSENGGPAEKGIARLWELAAASEKETQRRDALRHAARAGDMQAAAELFRVGGQPAMTTEKRIDILGQSLNFEAGVIFPASRLAFELP